MVRKSREVGLREVKEGLGINGNLLTYKYNIQISTEAAYKFPKKGGVKPQAWALHTQTIKAKPLNPYQTFMASACNNHLTILRTLYSRDTLVKIHRDFLSYMYLTDEGKFQITLKRWAWPVAQKLHSTVFKTKLKGEHCSSSTEAVPTVVSKRQACLKNAMI